MNYNLSTEEGRLAAAQEAGRNVAGYEIRSGHTEPRDWEKDGDLYAGVYSHLAALGFSRIGTRMYAVPFVDAYRAEYEAANGE